MSPVSQLGSPIVGHEDQNAPHIHLSLWDATSIVVGIVVGTAIFRTSSQVFSAAGGANAAFGAWLLGGVLSMVGAMCYAELATTYPRSGGDYVYLNRAFGPWAGFVFGWSQLTAVLAGSIGTMAYTFGDYGVRFLGQHPNSQLNGTVMLAVAAVLGLTLINLWRIESGKSMQNLLTLAKVLGLVCILWAGLFIIFSGRPVVEPQTDNVPTADSAEPAFGLAMVFVLYAYGGWNDAAFVAAEVHDRRRNIPRALLGGLAAITILYLAINGAYLAALGFEGARVTPTPAADVMVAAAGERGAAIISLLVMISALGAINGMLLTGSRLYAALGADHVAMRWLGSRTPWGIPYAALTAQAAIVIAMIVLVGTTSGRGSLDAALDFVGLAKISQERFPSGFDMLVAATAPMFWALFLSTGAALIVLRCREPDRDRPFAVPWYPLPPIVFMATCVFMLYSSVQYASWLTLLGFVPAVVGIAVFSCIARSSAL